MDFGLNLMDLIKQSKRFTALLAECEEFLERNQATLSDLACQAFELNQHEVSSKPEWSISLAK